MRRCIGKSVGKGIAAGRIFLYRKRKYALPQEKAGSAEEELRKFEEARQKSRGQLDALYAKAVREAGRESAGIFDVHRLVLDDSEYLDAVRGEIRQNGMSAASAVRKTGERFAKLLSSMDDAYMRERSADVLDISERLERILSGEKEEAETAVPEEPVILLAEDLSPSEAVQLDKSRILALVTRGGSASSHTAILARSMNIPALVQTDVELSGEYDGLPAAVDGFAGILYIEPEKETLDGLLRKKERADREQAELERLKGLENITRDGRRIRICANIGSVEEAEAALRADADGIGLFRSEFLYLGRDDFPSEEEQFEIYRKVLSQMNGKKVVIRTLDIGADKQADYFNLPEEENPALGYRAIRICLTRQDIFRTQLRAIYRASVYGDAAVMFPMIASVSEVRKAKEIAGSVKEELSAAGIPYREVELGIMVETPAAAIISDRLAEEVDFFSLGTNDLTQYTLAIDRQNQKLEAFYDAHHEAVLRLIGLTVKNAHAAGIWCGICGELGADTELTETFLDMGVDELSVAVSSVLRVRKAVREIGA